MSAAPGDPRLTRRAIGLQMAGMGLEFSASVLGGLALGYLVDDWLGTKPWFFLLGTFGGLAGSVTRLVQLSRRLDRLRREQEQTSGLR
ncbi:MAG: AtpZ/AtpI family protein [Deltaproteobacteria bacterium]|nr:AtpZ/AtpI family protein [Deltaproteobacteria bacterium]